VPHEALFPDAPPRRNLFLTLLGVLAVGVTLQLVRADGDIELTTSCTTPAFALSELAAARGRPVRWSMTGPDDGLYILAVDTGDFTRNDNGTYSPLPAAGVDRADIQAASPPTRLGEECRETGTFSIVSVPPGEHSVTMFRLTPARAERLGSTPFTVLDD